MTDRSLSDRRPRPDERALLDHLLALDEPGFEQLREQSLHAAVTSSSLSEISFRVPRDVTAPAQVARPVASRAVTFAEQGWADAYLWITDDGYIDSIEIMWDEETPDRLPRPDELAPASPIQTRSRDSTS
jgi:hypothetical protein